MNADHRIRKSYGTKGWLLVLVIVAFARATDVPAASVRFIGCPPRAEVYLEGTWIGEVPSAGQFMVSDLRAGEFRFSFFRDGTLLASIPVRLSDGENRRAVYQPIHPRAARSIPGTAADNPAGAPGEGTASPAVRPSNPPGVTGTAANRAVPAEIAGPPAAADLPEAPPSLAPLAVAILFSILVFAASYLFRKQSRAPAQTAEGEEDASPSVSRPPSIGPGSDAPRAPAFVEEIRWRESLNARGFVKARPVDGYGQVIDVEETPHDRN